ncbi:histidinol phosphate phosphatase domain-containing protein [Calditerrivibrio nitroreducens]|uniref:PHP domain protein n=1 Tax=Calditerrivibrio nitroreducens (strain DSM 19672 / NBRC 101217 / Yu37-1) TaxID=768670 RepID=E4TGQ1_CALNY|nr:histidinol phosphate phosphatase domain-containing protein [Calditerrivibrio nitroreducens]ADR19764.1 PHP domain protein [Calditerrivibrio nitroreducens DSM 19672]
MFDLHTHTTFSDGVLIPAESCRRAKVAGYQGIAITDHADESNFLFLLEKQLKFKEDFNKSSKDFKVIVGLEFTHVLPDHIGRMTEIARKNGADIILVHGETIVEPVDFGTNRSAIEAKVDILAHPGLIADEDAALAAKYGVHLEITTRKGHSLTNAYVAMMAKKYGCKLVIDNDFHAPGDYVSREMAEKILKGSGLNEEEINEVFLNNRKLFFEKGGFGE